MEDAMTFGDRVVGALKLEASAFEDVEADPTAMGQAVGVIVIAAVSTGIGNIFWGGLTGIVSRTLMSLIGFVVWSLLVWAIGTKVMPEPTTKADFAETFRTVGFAAAPGILGIITIIPVLGWLILFALWLWQLAAMIVAVKAVLDYSTVGKAIVVVIIGFIANLCITFFLSVIFGIGMLTTR
jgi:Yip1 domain